MSEETKHTPMTIEQAKRIITPGNGDEGVRYGFYVATGFIEGYAAHQEEIAKYKETIKNQLVICETIHYSWDCQLQQNREAFKELADRIKAQQETIKEMGDLLEALNIFLGEFPASNDTAMILSNKVENTLAQASAVVEGEK